MPNINHMPKPSPIHPGPPSAQSGAALLLMAMIIMAIAAAAILPPMLGSLGQLNREVQTRKALVEARDTLLGMFLTHYEQAQSFLSGLPAFGRWPETGQPGFSGIIQDPSNAQLWYATAAPLIQPLPIFTETSWLTVRDQEGDIIQDNVAIAILAPGPPLSGQRRTDDTKNNRNHHFEFITVNGTTYSNRDGNNEFVHAPRGESINDHLLWITRDELSERTFKLHKIRVESIIAKLNQERIDNAAYPDPCTEVVGNWSNFCDDKSDPENNNEAKLEFDGCSAVFTFLFDEDEEKTILDDPTPKNCHG